MLEAHLPSPEYKTDGVFTTILYKASAASPESGESKEKNQEKSKENTIYKAVRKLREDHVIEREGGDRGGYWKILR